MVGGVTYVNDSKATNVASAEVGVRSFGGGVRLIAGGRGKGSDYAPLAAPVRERCAGVYLIGETAAALRAALAPTGVPLHDCEELGRAVAEAHAAARPATSCCSPRAARRMTNRLVRAARGPLPDARSCSRLRPS